LLSRAGFDIAGLANNHTLDAGPAGLEETIRRLAAVGVIPVGAGIDADAAARPVIQNLKGLQIAFLAFNAVPSPDPPSPGWGVAGWEREQALQAVRRASIQAEAVVVSMHWGYEYEPRADPAQVDLAQALISAGADLVIGHHPHVAQEVIVQKRADGTSGAAALSLGNFLFDQGLTGTDHGLALRAFFDQDGLRAVQMLPVQAGLRPRLASLEQPLPAVQHIQPRQEMEIYICAQNACAETGTSSKTANLAGIFHTGQIDLTGDQQMEEVQLKNRRIMVYEKGRLTWESPPEWRILDLALGDPDADGRNDLVVALEKPDAKGVMQSHPFVIGYRGGVYRTVWGGSPVRDPVIEVELEDVNGDGEIELVVLEEEREGKGRAVTVWHWHGWGFSLDWRSPYGQFEDMHAQGQEIRVNNSQE
jgi:poly-gamma-glutamate synthesis protein (capsule biosynthesis protein)